jgi:hypothetical protein
VIEGPGELRQPRPATSVGVRLDLSLTPKLRAYSLNASYLRFDKTGALSFLVFQAGNPQGHRLVDLGGGLILPADS